MPWKKLGLIYSPDARRSWSRTHAQTPVAHRLEGSVYRVFFATRSDAQVSSIGSVDLELDDPPRVLDVAQQPVLSPGPIGHFDEHGVYPSSIVELDGKLYLYYIGWTRGERPPLFYAAIGLAISTDGGQRFERHSPAPIVDRGAHDPCLVTAPCVLRDEGVIHMYYVSGIKWELVGDKLQSYYHTKYASSTDGIGWKRTDRVAIDLRPGVETNLGRCSVLRDGSRYRMWLCHASETTPYRIGYAESTNALDWVRKDAECDLTVSASGFDSEMICYPYVIRHDDRLFAFYNGNGYGRDGIGLAVEAGE